MGGIQEEKNGMELVMWNFGSSGGTGKLAVSSRNLKGKARMAEHWELGLLVAIINAGAKKRLAFRGASLSLSGKSTIVEIVNSKIQRNLEKTSEK
jgi:hypothetical protein